MEVSNGTTEASLTVGFSYSSAPSPSSSPPSLSGASEPSGIYVFKLKFYYLSRDKLIKC